MLAAKEKFQGACLDTGAQHTVIGKPQAEAYRASIRQEADLETEKELRSYRLCGCTFDTLGAVSIRLPIAEDYFVPLFVNVIAWNVPFLLGLDIMDRYRMYVNKVTNHLVCVNEGVAVPVVRKYGRIYLDRGSDVLYTLSELQRIHKHFYHAKPVRLYALMRRYKVKEATPGTLRQLEKVAEARDVCQRLAEEPSRFRVSMPKEVLCFNRRVMIDLMMLEQMPVFHVVDRDTLFSAATFLRDRVSSKSVWDAFLRIWVAVYAGYPEQLHANPATNLQSDEWKQMVCDAGIKPIDSGIESHNSLGAGERYHAMLRQIYRTVRMDHAITPLDVALALAVWAINQTAGPSGISPESLVLGGDPRIPVKPANLPGHRERCQAIAEARADLVKPVAQARLRKALPERLRRTAELEVGPGTRVLVFREKFQKWKGPYMVEGSDGKLLKLNIKDQLMLFSIHQIKLYKPSLRPVSAKSGTEETAASRESAPTGTEAAEAPSRSTGATTPAVEAMETNATTTANMSAVINGTSRAAHNVSDGISAADALVISFGRRIREVARR